jgi:predicted ATP-grasp superfamily ATP-dependent carboligase
LSALFVASQYGTTCLGVTRQFVGKPGNRYSYRGTLAPWPVEPAVIDRIEQMGQAIATGFHVTGLFGIDLILEASTVWLIEINPRYTAAIEALEWAGGRSLLTDHLASFGFAQPLKPLSIQPRGFVGKAIVHADRSFTWGEEIELSTQLDEMPEVADIPDPGTSFDAGEPVLTVLASGANPADCRRNLATRIKFWKQRIARPSF